MKTFTLNFFALLVVSCWLIPVKNNAQNPFARQDSTQINGELEEITITAFRTPYNIFNTPAPINLILPKNLQTGDALTPIEALNQIPGVLMHHGTLNTNRLTIRGIGSRTTYATNKIKAYFGEIPLTTGDGETILEDLENTAIKRVEIIKGPSSSLYGAGLAGVLLFHPKTVLKDFVQNQFTVASFGTVKEALSAGINDGKLRLYALGTVLNSDGYRDNNNTNRNNLLLNSVWSFSKKSNMQMLLKATKVKGYIPSSLDWETFRESPESAASNWAAINGFEKYTNAQLGVSFNSYTIKEGKISVAAFGSIRNLNELRPFNRLKESSDYIGWRAYIQRNISTPQISFVLTSGIEMFRENYIWSTFDNDNGEILSDNNEKRQYENLFVQIESNFNNRFFVSAGLNNNLTRFIYTDIFHNNGDLSQRRDYKPVLSPRLGVNVVITEACSIYGNISHGFSTPTFEETLLPEGQINSEIKPESGWNFEMGFRSRFSNRLQFAASYYRIYINDLLVARRTGEDAYVGVNAGQSVHPGMEAEITWVSVTHKGLPLLTLRGNVTLANYHFNDFVDLDSDYSGNLLPGTAKETCFLGASLNPGKNLSLNASYRFTGKMPVNDANSSFSDSFGLSNFELKYKGKSGNLKLEISSGIQNIFDVHYASMLAVNALSFNGNQPRYYYPGNPRNYYFTVLIGLIKKD